MIGRTVAHYRILDFLGVGPTGSVYRAEDLRRHRLVALRILAHDLGRNPPLLARLRQSMEAVARLDHPAIPRVYDQGADDDFRYVAMQLVDGESLESRLRRGPIPLVEVARIGVELAEALQAAHRRGVVHGNLRPERIVLAGGGVRVLGFGLMTPAEPQEAAGTPRGSEPRAPYRSPEQAAGAAPDARGDIYSLGAILYQLVGGRPPFAGDTASELNRAIRNEKPESLTRLRPELHPSLEKPILRALSKDPARRQRDAGEILEELSSAAQDLNAMSLARAPLIRRRRRHFGTWLPTAATIFLLVIIWLLWQAVHRLMTPGQP